MTQEKQTSNGVEWKINVTNGSSKIIVQDSENIFTRFWNCFKGLFLKVWKFFQNAKNIGKNDPRKVFHCLKVGMALTIVSIFYYMKPLYEGVGGNAMWAIMTVVVVFENSVGSSIYKSLNRVCGTSLAGMLAFSVHWVANKSGDQYEPFIVGASVFLLASAATFSRFIPSVKQKFDYGAMIFILTFSLIAVSGYRVEKLFEMVHERIFTIIIGISLCIFVSMLICPIWAGGELHKLICSNMDKLANSLDGCVAEYFNHNNEEVSDKNLLGYKCVLTSKATEDSLANFARWEPAHGCFNFKHPWKQYLKIGASMRSVAYCIEALSSCIYAENQAPESIKKKLCNICLNLSSSSSTVVKELSKSIRTMKKPSNIDFLAEEMNTAVEELQDALKSLSNLHNQSNETDENSATMNRLFPLLEVIPVVTFSSLMIEIAERIKNVVKEVEELGELADFKEEKEVKVVEISRIEDDDDEETVKTLQRV
ncbi:aluminum-activated malate transporter 10 [Euphorbia lathyris]|uniref:aluminum-activated malate transporter 10 n=1 Tax=Euphorbia lathyris TaxID=212925 RepID=UPI003313E1D3